jgi:hypothetical protein
MTFEHKLKINVHLENHHTSFWNIYPWSSTGAADEVPSADHSFTNSFMAENVALHKNGIEIYQNVNGGISFHLTPQENSMRHRTMLCIFFVQYLPLYEKQAQ